MARPVLYIGDQNPPLQTTLKDGDGQPINLTGKTVHFALVLDGDTTPAFRSQATPANQTTSPGEVTYTPDSDDYDVIVAGVYHGYWIIGYGTAEQQTVDAGEFEVARGASGTPAVAGVVAAAYALTTVAAVKRQLAIPAADTGPDQAVQRYINAASLMMIQYAGREFAPQSTNVARTFNVAANGYVDLAPYDLRVADLVEMVEAGSGLAPFTQTVSADYYILDETSQGTAVGLRLEYWPGSFAVGWPVRVTGDWGFPAVPDDVAKLCEDQAAYWYRRAQQIRTGLAGVEGETGPVSVGGSASLLTTVRQALDYSYRIPVAA